MQVVNQRFIALPREAGTPTLGSAGFANWRHVSRKYTADPVKQTFVLNSEQFSISSHVSAPRLYASHRRSSRAVSASSDHPKRR
jgi:hypothetical protein